ncbi:ankyrin-1-like [Trichogramma pretiosum]|uniref:ankyrin-1-like n=1 Tax=Trichogramma pretiosum TaxID=7493 RepID=UPI000C71AF2B|nr:ankyrin-1-like [Trichogramma pretiosum]
MAEHVDLKTIKSLREEVNWEVETERQINRLISDSAKGLLFYEGDGHVKEYQRFIVFVFRIYYRSGDPELDRLLLRVVSKINFYRDLTIPRVRRLIFKTYAKFDANYFDEETRPEHFHLACKFACHDLVEKFLELGQDPNHPQRETGNSPLLSASWIYVNGARTIELLLRNGANPNAVNRYGSTPLHRLCESRSPNHIKLIERFLVVCDEVRQRLHINAWDKRGRAPLHLALEHGRQKVVELLLRRGASPNLTDSDGSTPLHFICYRYDDDEFARILFEICDEMQLTVQINARDKWGKTPLQLAVANLLPNTVDVLLNRGADITNCIFSTSINTELQIGSSLFWKMRVASGALAVAEHLEARGYRFSRSDALTIMKFFAKHDLFDESSDLEKSLRHDQEFTNNAKEMMIVPSLSLYDLIHLKSEEEEKLLTYTDYFVFAGQLSSGFFRRWTLDPFHELIHKRLPIECCEMVLEKLNNQDLCNICLAVASQTSS